MYCPGCGRELVGKDRICPDCGPIRLPKDARDIGGSARPVMNFSCSYCGVRIKLKRRKETRTILCPNCKRVEFTIPGREKGGPSFGLIECSKCGSRLEIPLIDGAFVVKCRTCGYKHEIRRNRPTRVADGEGIRRTIDCGACHRPFEIEILAMPMKVQCPHCRAVGILKKVPEERGALPEKHVPRTTDQTPSPDAQMPLKGRQKRKSKVGKNAPRIVTCPKCHSRFDVKGKPPFKIKCPSCGMEGVIKK